MVPKSVAASWQPVAANQPKGQVLQIARAYERRTTDVEREWRQRISAERITEVS